MTPGQHIHAVPLPAGGDPVDLWIEDGVLVEGPLPEAEEVPGGWVAQGLVDAHVHLTFETHERLGLPRGTDELIDAQLGLQRAAGVFAVRDAGSLPGVPPP